MRHMSLFSRKPGQSVINFVYHLINEGPNLWALFSNTLILIIFLSFGWILFHSNLELPYLFSLRQWWRSQKTRDVNKIVWVHLTVIYISDTCVAKDIF